MPHQCTNCGRAFGDGSKEMLSGCPDCGGNKFQFLPAGAMDGATGGGPDAAGRSGGGTAGGTAPKKAPDDAPPSATGAPGSSRGSSAPETEGDDASAVDRAAATVREWVSTKSSDDDSRERDAGNDRAWPGSTGNEGRSDARGDAPTDARNGPTRASTPEDAAQANARSDVVSRAELPDEPPASAADAAELSAADAAEPAADAAETPAGAEVAETPDDNSPGLKELRQELNSQFESIRIAEPGQYELNLMELFEREEYIIALQEDGKYVIEVPDGWEDPDR